MNDNLYFGITEFDEGEIFIAISTTNNGEVDDNFSKKQISMIERMVGKEFYQAEAGLLMCITDYTKQQVIKKFKDAGFIYCNKLQEDWSMASPTCKGCGKTPDELEYYIEQAKAEKCTPDDIAREDGTYNSITNKFYCFPCYIKAGMPLGKA